MKNTGTLEYLVEKGASDLRKSGRRRDFAFSAFGNVTG
jgi:hypothetical protein